MYNDFVIREITGRYPLWKIKLNGVLGEKNLISQGITCSKWYINAVNVLKMKRQLLYKKRTIISFGVYESLFASQLLALYIKYQSNNKMFGLPTNQQWKLVQMFEQIGKKFQSENDF